MNYYEKYLKYKSKYLQLKNNNNFMIGGDKPVAEILKNINLFNDKPQLEPFFNPTYGFILNETDFIINILNFYDESVIDDDDNIFTLVHKLFTKVAISNEVKPTKSLFNIMDTREIGMLLAYLYLSFVKFKDPEQKNKINKSIDKLNELIKNIDSFTKKYNFSKLKPEKKTEICKIKSAIEKKIKTLYNEDFASVIFPDVELEKPIYENRYINDSLINALKKYRTQLQNIIIKPKFNNSEINAKIYKHINLDKIDENVFHVILAVLWWISDNKQSIRYYYEGLNEILPSNMRVSIPEYFDDELFTKAELNNTIPDNFELALAITYKNYVSFIKIIEYQYAETIYANKFADCGETSLRNFINIISYDITRNKFDIGKLISIGANDQIVEYYSTFNNINKQVSTRKEIIFGKSMNGRDAWAVVVSNIQHVNYVNKQAMTIGPDYKYELQDGLSKVTIDDIFIVNMLAVLQNLFSNIKNWSDFSVLISDINVNLNDEGYGTITFESHNFNYKWVFMHSHYKFEQTKSDDPIDLRNLTKKQICYIDCIASNIMENSLFITYFYYIKHTNNSLMRHLNFAISKYFDNTNYLRILNYAYKNFYRREKFNIVINFNKIKDISKFILSEFDIYINYDETGFKNYENIKKIKINKNYKLDKFVNLETLIYSSDFDESVDGTLYKLSNLRTVEFGNSFNQELSFHSSFMINLHNLTFGNDFNSFNPIYSPHFPLVNLQSLTFGHNFNKILGSSLWALTNLKSLTFGNNYNQRLDSSLCELENLQNLTFGNDYNRGLRDSLNDLVNLQTLTFGDNFNKKLYSSFDKLINLQTLTFGDNFNQKLGTSLNSLVKLQSLILGFNFNQELGMSLNALENLQTLNLSNDFNQELGTSLYPLVNLESLIFYHSFNQELGTSLDSLVNLQTLELGDKFNHELSTSLDSLVNLQKLSLSNNFNKKLDTSLSRLTKLETLKFGSEFNKELDTSLDSLVNLQSLIFSENFNKKLDSSLNKLVNLKKIYFGDSFNQNLGTSLDSLENLEMLSLGGNFDKELNTSLDKLVNLQNLYIPESFNQELGTSLDPLVNLKMLFFVNISKFNKDFGTSLYKLTNLQTLNLSSDFNRELGTSLYPLVNLESLTFGFNFNQELSTSLNSLVKLKSLTFGNIFDKTLSTSLDKLINLESLTFGNNFNQVLGTSLDKLINLQSLTFDHFFNQKLGTSLDKLINLQNLTFGVDFDFELDTSLDKLVKLKNVTFGEFYEKKLGTSFDKLSSLEKIGYGEIVNI
jgi:leucine-rich repeat protein SHOC2